MAREEKEESHVHSGVISFQGTRHFEFCAGSPARDGTNTLLFLHCLYCALIFLSLRLHCDPPHSSFQAATHSHTLNTQKPRLPRVYSQEWTSEMKELMDG